MKKKILLVLVAVITLFITTPVFAAQITACNGAFGNGVYIDSKIPNAIHIVILGIQIFIPVLLVLFGTIDLLKGVTAGKEDEIKKGQNIFIKRLIAAAIVFFVPAIVSLVISLVADSSEKEGISKCMKCFIKGGEACGSVSSKACNVIDGVFYDHSGNVTNEEGYTASCLKGSGE